MFTLPDSWVWDFWFADDGEQYHLFFLYASRALHDPDARHYRASIGHATSTDLRDWTRVPDALVRSDAPAFDDLATWTGSVVQHPDGTWFLFYTGSTLTPAGNVQRIGYATSADLLTWHKSPDNPVLQADGHWYEVLADDQWHDEAFRDPWVFERQGRPCRRCGTRGCSPTRTATAGTCSSPRGRGRVRRTTAGSWAGPGRRTCARGSCARRCPSPDRGSDSSR